MNAKILHLKTWPLLPAALLALTSGSSPSVPPPPVGTAQVIHAKGVPGATVLQTLKVTCPSGLRHLKPPAARIATAPRDE